MCAAGRIGAKARPPAMRATTARARGIDDHLGRAPPGGRRDWPSRCRTAGPRGRRARRSHSSRRGMARRPPAGPRRASFDVHRPGGSGPAGTGARRAPTISISPSRMRSAPAACSTQADIAGFPPAGAAERDRFVGRSSSGFSCWLRPGRPAARRWPSSLVETVTLSTLKPPSTGRGGVGHHPDRGSAGGGPDRR